MIPVTGPVTRYDLMRRFHQGICISYTGISDVRRGHAFTESMDEWNITPSRPRNRARDLVGGTMTLDILDRWGSDLLTGREYLFFQDHGAQLNTSAAERVLTLIWHDMTPPGTSPELIRRLTEFQPSDPFSVKTVLSHYLAMLFEESLSAFPREDRRAMVNTAVSERIKACRSLRAQIAEKMVRETIIAPWEPRYE